MMKLKVLVVLTALCLLLSACGNTVVSSQRENSEPEDVLSSAAVQPGELIETYVPEYAKGFSIEYYEGGAKIIDTHIEATASTAAAAHRARHRTSVPYISRLAVGMSSGRMGRSTSPMVGFRTSVPK